MRFLARTTLLICLPLGLMLTTTEAQTSQKQGTAIILGRVTLDGKPIANIGVALLEGERTPQRRAVSRVTTDYEGRYRMTNVPAGRYSVVAIAPALVGPNDGNYGEPGKTVTIAEGETVEDIDFALIRGGVITGRVTDAEGQPVIGERVQLSQAEKQRQDRGRGFSNANPFMYQTDDRGIYRVYGIPPGRYNVSVGESMEAGSVRFGFGGRGFYNRTFHPDVTEEAKATIIEVREGSETTNVDISVKRKSKSFTATGRVLDETGKPLVGARIGHGAVLPAGNMGGFGWGSISDANGNFRLDGLLPGRYAAFVWNEGNIEGYSDPAKFEIVDRNLTGLELKLRSGSSISGVASIEGTNDRTVIAKLSQLSIAAYMENEGAVAPSYANVKIAPDGSFRLAGLRPGKARLHLNNYPPPPGLTLARIEREGVPVREIDISPGAHISGIRVVFEYGTGSVRGVVKIENGPLPEGARMYISSRRRGDTTGMIGRGSQVDSRGRFLLEGMPTGEHELILQTYMMSGSAHKIRPVKQNVVVTSGVELEVTFMLDLKSKEPEGIPNE